MIKFTKMHGAGNDYIYVYTPENQISNPSQTAIEWSKPHFGIGSDGLILIGDSEIADFSMHIYNNDGSEAMMCGNGVRCVAKFVYDKGLTDKKEITVETLSGIKKIQVNTDSDNKVVSGRVDMGEPILRAPLIPIDIEKESVIDYPVAVDGAEYKITGVSMGNPHAVVFVDDPGALNLEKIGPFFENHVLFPERINTEFVNVIDRETVEMRVWERGAGETLACGTGACATTVACVLNGLTERKVTVKLVGGDLTVEWDEDTGHVFMTGPAEEVFSGEINLDRDIDLSRWQ